MAWRLNPVSDSVSSSREPLQDPLLYCLLQATSANACPEVLTLQYRHCVDLRRCRAGRVPARAEVGVGSRRSLPGPEASGSADDPALGFGGVADESLPGLVPVDDPRSPAGPPIVCLSAFFSVGPLFASLLGIWMSGVPTEGASPTCSPAAPPEAGGCGSHPGAASDVLVRASGCQRAQGRMGRHDHPVNPPGASP